MLPTTIRRSATGFGAAEGPAGRGQLRVEIRTVNHRFFNPAFKMPGELAPLEGDLNAAQVAIHAPGTVPKPKSKAH